MLYYVEYEALGHLAYLYSPIFRAEHAIYYASSVEYCLMLSNWKQHHLPITGSFLSTIWARYCPCVFLLQFKRREKQEGSSFPKNICSCQGCTSDNNNILTFKRASRRCLFNSLFVKYLSVWCVVVSHHFKESVRSEQSIISCEKTKWDVRFWSGFIVIRKIMFESTSYLVYIYLYLYTALFIFVFVCLFMYVYMFHQMNKYCEKISEHIV